jgi:hypothetical protein
MIPATGSITLRGTAARHGIQAEFGGAATNIKLGAYYRGGARVSAGAKVSIATAGVQKFSNYRGASAHVGIVAKGGTETIAGGKKHHTFLGNGVFTVTQAGLAQHAIVAGGGSGGGNRAGGGGGAGGALMANYTFAVAAYPVVIGAGGGAQVSSGVRDKYGTGTPYQRHGMTGNDSSVGTLVAIGGGGGGSPVKIPPPPPGGSGGGGNGFTWHVGGAGTPGQGNTGGSGDGRSGTNYYAGGGGGAGEVGQFGKKTRAVPPDTRSFSAGKGGNGRVYTGNGVTYAGGGGGGSNNRAGVGGTGGGGHGHKNATQGTVGTPHTGGGGGGSGRSSTVGEHGGSGIVIISYPFP